MLIKVVISLIVLIAFAIYTKVGIAAEGWKETGEDIPRLCEVDTNLFRGGQPTQEGYRQLQAEGIKKIISFRHEKKYISQDREQVEALGMEYVSLPWMIGLPYKKEIFTLFFKEIQTKQDAPIFFHCKRGSERTGVMTGAYLIKEKGYTWEEAYEEIKQFSIKPIFMHSVKSKLKTFARLLTL